MRKVIETTAIIVSSIIGVVIAFVIVSYAGKSAMNDFNVS